MLLLAPSKQNWSIVQFTINVWISLKIVILVNFEGKWFTIFVVSRNFEGWFCSEKSTNFCSKDVKRRHSLIIYMYVNNRFLRNSGLLKIRLFQCYVALWIHNIDPICKTNSQVCSPCSLLNNTNTIQGRKAKSSSPCSFFVTWLL